MGLLAKMRRGRDPLVGEYAQGVVLRVVEEQKWFVLVFEHRGVGVTDFEVVFPNLRYFQITPEEFLGWCLGEGRPQVTRVYEAVGEYVRHRDVKEAEDLVCDADAVVTGAMLSVSDVVERWGRVKVAKRGLVSALLGERVGTVFTL